MGVYGGSRCVSAKLLSTAASAAVLMFTPCAAVAQVAPAAPETAPVPPLAQQTAPDAEAPAAAPTQAEETPSLDNPLADIVVTAQKRETRLQDTPIAITAITDQGLVARSASDVSAVASIAPNVQFQGSAPLSGGSFNATVFIRGIGQNDASVFNDPGVGVYLDGVYLGRSTGAVLELADIERIEVLRGPQGTLFGKNAVGGAVNIISKQPTSEFEASATGTVGNFDRTDISAVVSGPIVGDAVLGRLSVGYFKRDGYVRRLTDNELLGDKNVFGARGQVHIRASDALGIDLSGDYTRIRQNSAALTLLAVSPTGAPFLNIFNQAVAPTLPIVAPNGIKSLNSSWVTGDPYTTWQSGPNVNDLDQYGFTGTAILDVAYNLSIRSITAYRNLKSTFGRDGDNTPYDFRHTFDVIDQNQFSQELQLLGDLWDKRLEFVVGAYYFHERAVDDAIITLASGVYSAAGPPPRNNVALDLVFRQFNDIRSRSLAGFMSGTFHITDTLSTTFGLRYTDERKTLFTFERRFASGTFIVDPNVLRILYGRYPLQRSWSDWSPRIGLEYKPDDDILLYASASKGFKSGSFNGRATGSSADVRPFDPETVWNYEAGIKSQLLGRRLTLNLTGFRMDYKDIQITVNRTPDNFVANAAAARLQGAELEFRAVPIDGVSFDGTVGYLDAKYDRVGGVGLVLPITTASRLVRAPRWTANAGAQYDATLNDGSKLTLRGDLSHVARQFYDAANTPLISQGPYTLLSARIAYTLPEKSLTFALFGTNLGDKRYLISGNAASPAFGNITEGTYARPREYGLSVTARF